MRFIRAFLITVVGLALLVAAIAISPPFQEWAATRILSRLTHTEVLTVGSASVGLRSLAFENLRLRKGDAALNFPALSVTLPLRAALRGATPSVESLVAKGWTIDLTRTGETATATKPSVASPSATPALPASLGDPLAAVAWLKTLILPGTCKSIDLEGDFLLPSTASQTTATVHLALKGGALAPGANGNFTVDVTCDPLGAYPAFRAQGDLVIAAAASGAIERLAFEGRAAPEGKRIPADLRVSAEVSTSAAAAGEKLGVKLTRGDRNLVAIEANAPAATQRFQGTWALALSDSDMGIFLAAGRLPVASATGSGAFEAATDFREVHVAGQLKASALPVALALPNAGALSAVRFDGTFDVRRTDGRFDVARLEGDIAGTSPLAHLRMIQPCRVDAQGRFTVENVSADWLEVTATGLPLALFSGDRDRFRMLDGALTGTIVLRLGGDTLHARTQEPLTVTGAALRLPEGTVLRDLGASVGLTAELARGKAWTIHVAPLSLQSGEHRLLTLDAELRGPADAYGRLPASGDFQVNLSAWKTWRGTEAWRWLPAGDLRGTFSGNLSDAADVTLQFKLTDPDPSRWLSGQIAAGIDGYTAFTLRAPLELHVSSDTTELLAEGKWSIEPGVHHVDLQFSSKRLGLAQLRSLSNFVPALAGAAGEKDALAAGERPLWHPITGRMRFDLQQLTIGDREWRDVGATLAFEPAALQLTGGRARFIPQPVKSARPSLVEMPTEPSRAATLEGTVAFDPQAAHPYQLKAKASLDVIPAWRLFGWASDRTDALLEGHWSLSDAITGSGTTLLDVLTRRRDELHLESSGGTLRLLRVNIGDAIPDEATPVTDTLANIGAAAGALFGRRGNTIAGQRKLPAATEALLAFTYQTKEISYEKISVTAQEDLDGTLQLRDLEITAANTRMKGTGRILNAPEQPVSGRPLNLNLELAFRGSAAERLIAGGLVLAAKDADGFVKVREPVPFAGTLQQIDNREWHDLLAKAATPKPEAKK